MSQQRNTSNARGGCGFCKRNREPTSVYLSHQLKNQAGQVVCPQLSKYRCELCGSTGAEAHTRSYCPQVINIRQQQRQLEAERASSSRNQLTDGQSKGAASVNSDSQQEQQSNSGDDDNDDDFSIQIELGRARMMSNMGTVSHSRYNSAGRLRHPPRFNQNNNNNNNNNHRQQHNRPRPLNQQHYQRQQQDTSTNASPQADYFRNYRQ